jgi:hypothetical protein
VLAAAVAVAEAAGVDDGALLLSLPWQPASASRATHRIGRRFNMEYLEWMGRKPTAPAQGRRVIDQGVGDCWVSALCRPSM